MNNLHLSNLTATYPSYAKLNFGLRIINRDAKNYHNIATFFQLIDLHDNLEFSWTPLPQEEQLAIKPEHLKLACQKFLDNLTITGMDDCVTKEQNLIFKAAKALLEASDLTQAQVPEEFFTHQLEIKVDKHIPDCAGLGGGSSNGALTMLVLNKDLGLNHQLDSLVAIGITVGCDIPIFLTGKSQFAWGYGQKFLNYLESMIVANDIYAQVDRQLLYQSDPALKLSVALKLMALKQLEDSLLMENRNNVDVLVDYYFENNQPFEMLLILPNQGMSTKEGFASLQNVVVNLDPDYLNHKVEPGCEEFKVWVMEDWKNDFESGFLAKFPWMSEFGKLFQNRVCLTGTGSCFYVPLLTETEFAEFSELLQAYTDSSRSPEQQIKILKVSCLPSYNNFL